VKPNRALALYALALYWYRRAYRRGYRSAANNVGIVYRNEGKPRQALSWFKRAVALKDADANVEIAKIHIESKNWSEASRYLSQALRAMADDITEGATRGGTKAAKANKKPAGRASENVRPEHVRGGKAAV
jgi:TPR repeat protein